MQIHPDGLILGTGTSTHLIRIWDIKTKTVAAELSGHNGSVTSMDFSENGYYLATASLGHGGVKVWDLRKLSEVIELDVGDGNVYNIKFDFSGQYLAVAVGKTIK